MCYRTQKQVSYRSTIKGCSHKWRETNWECDSITFSNKSIIITVTYLKFVIFFTQPQFEAKKFYTWKTINWQQKLSRDETVCKMLHCGWSTFFPIPIGIFDSWSNFLTWPAVLMIVRNMGCAWSTKISHAHVFSKRALPWEMIWIYLTLCQLLLSFFMQRRSS